MSDYYDEQMRSAGSRERTVLSRQELESMKRNMRDLLKRDANPRPLLTERPDFTRSA